MLQELKIFVLSGGPGSEREISKASAKSVIAALKSKNINAVEIDIKNADCNIPQDTDLAYNLIHGTFGEDGQLQQILADKNIAYTGAGIDSSKLAFDKIASKERFFEKNISTPNFKIIDIRDTNLAIEKCQNFATKYNYPIVLKPACEGSSVGVHIIKNKHEIPTSIDEMQNYGSKVLLEQFVKGRELTVGILDNTALPIVEIIPQDGFYDMKNKYPWLSGEGGSSYICPASISPKLTLEIQQLALAAHKYLDVEIYSRVDVMLGEDNIPHVLEINTIPGMTETSLLPKSAQASGIDFADLCLKIAKLSYKLRGTKNSNYVA